MIVVAVKIRFFILRLVVSKLVLAHKPAFQKKFDGIVQGRPAYPVLLILHFDVERFNVKMIITVVDLLENGKTLGSLAVSFLFQVFGKDILYNCLVVFIDYFLAHDMGAKV